ncbi:MAG: hypothetical protein KF773_06300 [Deltaproteobacteria bacterium]|nr:hypothetical protein [Deltaproteobacteria bacterium]
MGRLITVAILLAAGSAQAEPRRGKPTAPLRLELVSKPVSGGHEVTLVATPRRDVPSVELTLGDKRAAFGASAAGRPVTLTVFVAGDADVRATGRAAGRSTAKAIRVGAARLEKAAPPATLRTLPDGRVVREVRR